MRTFALMAILCAACALAQAQNIVQIEYFIDGDPGYGSGTQVTGFTPAGQINDVKFSIAAGTIAAGMHRLFIRAKNANGQWSMVSEQVIYRENLAATASNINRLEYFVDTDPGYGQAAPVPVAASTVVNNVTFSIPATGLATGIHRLFVRARNASGQWSIVSEHLFYKEQLSAILPNITRLEYFIDTDPGYGAATAVPITAAVALTDFQFTIPSNNLPEGVHRLFLRAKDGAGGWSVLAVRSFTVPPPPLPVQLVSFSGQKSEQNALLAWVTTDEAKSAYFEIQRSKTGLHWETAGRVKAAPVSTRENEYAFTDHHAGIGEVLYRLKMVDTDSAFAYSKVISLDFMQPDIMRIYPNPAHGQMQISSQIPMTGYALETVDGKTIKSALLTQTLQAEIDLKRTSSGLYLIRLFLNDGTIQVRKVIVQ